MARASVTASAFIEPTTETLVQPLYNDRYALRLGRGPSPNDLAIHGEGDELERLLVDLLDQLRQARAEAGES